MHRPTHELPPQACNANPIQKKTMSESDTPRTDEWETYCDECYYHLWRVRRKNERKFDDGFHVQNGEGARQLVELLNKQDSELTAARAEIDKWEQIACDKLSEVCRQIEKTRLVTEQRDRAWQTIAEIKRDIMEDETFGDVVIKLWQEPLDEAIEQRDRLAEALNKIQLVMVDGFDKLKRIDEIATEALQSPTTKDHE